MIYTVKGFGTINKAVIDVFLEFSTFHCVQWMLVIWSPVPVPFLNPAWTLGSTWFMYLFEALLEEFWALLFWHVRWMHLCSSLNPLDLEWKLTFSRPVATAEISKFAWCYRFVIPREKMLHRMLQQGSHHFSNICKYFDIIWLKLPFLKNLLFK